MAQFRSTAPCFVVADIGATIRWYEAQLGFKGNTFPSAEPYQFGILFRDEIEIMLQRIEGYEKPDIYDRRNGGVWNAYIRMQGVKDFYESVCQHVDIIRPLGKQFYGDWEFEVKDPNGYVLVFSEFTD